MINTLKRATKLAPWLSVVAILATAAPASAQAPSQAQRDAIKSQCRSDYIAHCSSVPAGRGGLAAMPAEEHVEPLVELPERRTRGRSTGGCDCQAGRHRRTESRSTRRCNDCSAQSYRAKGCSNSPCGTAKQRADFGHPQRMPLRLSEGLRGCADRRRSRPAMPGEEQGQTFGRLRKGRLRGRRRWRNSGSARGRRGSGRGSRCTSGANRDRAAADAAA